MKKSLLFLAGMLITIIATSQKQELKEDQVTPPFFRGEFPLSVSKYVQERAQYPPVALKSGIHGTVVVGFVITPEGDLSDFEVINSVSEAVDNEVIRVLKSTNGKWTPGSINGEAVSRQDEVAVVFKLFPEDNFTKNAKKYFHKGNHALFQDDQPEKALKFYNHGIKYLPNDETLLALRGFCKYRLGDEIGADRDWGRLKVLANRRDSNTEFKHLAEFMKKPGVPKELSELIQEIQK